MAGQLRRLCAASSLAFFATSAFADLALVQQPYPDGRQAPAEIYLTGEITQGSPRQFLDLVISHGLTKATVYFHSEGGDLLSGIELGEQIRKAGFNTAIGKQGTGFGKPQPGKCQSSCVLSLVGGYFRFADQGSVIGIHRFFKRTAGEQDLDVAQVLSAAITGYLIRMGADPQLFERMVQVGRGKMQLLALDEAFRLNVVNNGVLPAEWKIEGRDGQVYLKGQQETWLGTGKVLVSCAKGRTASLSALYDAGTNTDRIAADAVSYSLRIDNKFIPITSPQLRARPQVQGDYILARISPTPPLIVALEQADQIGFAYHPKEAGDFFGFLVDARKDHDMIQSFLNHCRGI